MGIDRAGGRHASYFVIAEEEMKTNGQMDEWTNG
jgi:hypothetical protein